MATERWHVGDGATCYRCGLRTALHPLTTCLRCHRAVRGESQAATAHRLGIPANTLARWERGELRIQHPTILALALSAPSPE